MHRRFILQSGLCLLGSAWLIAAEPSPADPLVWHDLPPLPNAAGLGGPFGGVHHGVLIVAGGANFPDQPPWQDGKKVWYDDVYVLEPDAIEWRSDPSWKLDGPRAYGGSVSIEQGVVLIGGNDAQRVYADVRLLEWDEQAAKIIQRSLPPLPTPSCYLAAGRVGEVIYVAAGQPTSEPGTLTHAFWSLDLSPKNDRPRWIEREPWPGPPRIKAALATQSGGSDQRFVYLFSGEIPTRTDDGEIARRYVVDAYRFDPAAKPGQSAWARIADVPKPIAAGSAIDVGQSHVLTFSGSTGAHVNEALDTQPSFTQDVLAYHTITDTWLRCGTMPVGVVTTAVTRWDDRIVITSGETRPGVRTPRIQAARLAATDVAFGGVNYAVLVAYLARRGRSTDDYFLAGRRIPWWAAGLSIYATQLSAITFIATPGLIYATDWMVAPAVGVILLMAPVIIIFYLPFFRRLEITTAYEYLEQRFDLPVRLFGSASFITFQLGRMAIVVYLPALALTAITGIDIYACILMMGVLATLYTVLGGIEAVVWTDVLQVIVLLGGLLIGLVIILGELGGPAAVYRVALDDGKFRMTHWSMSTTELATWSLVIGSFMLQFGPYTTDQSVIQRYLTTKDEKAAARSIWLNGFLSVPFLILFYIVGTSLYVFFKSRPELLSVGMQNDQALPLFVARRMPVGLSGLVIAGVFAASMSSLDSSMHSIATALTVDFYRRFKPQATDRRCLRLARAITVIVGLAGTFAACLLARYDIKSLFFFFQGLLGLVSSGLVGIFILGIFTRRSNGPGVLTGALTSIAVLVYVTGYTDVNFFLYAVIGIGTSVAAGYFASLCLPGSSKDTTGLTYATVKALQPGRRTPSTRTDTSG